MNFDQVLKKMLFSNFLMYDFSKYTFFDNYQFFLLELWIGSSKDFVFYLL